MPPGPWPARRGGEPNTVRSFAGALSAFVPFPVLKLYMEQRRRSVSAPLFCCTPSVLYLHVVVEEKLIRMRAQA